MSRWCIGTLQKGFRLWHQNGRFIKTLELPSTVRNVNKSWGRSNSLVMSREDVYAVAGIRYQNQLKFLQKNFKSGFTRDL